MTKSEQKFSNILGKLVITTRERDSMEVGCVGICVAVAPSLANSTYNAIVKHIDFVKYGLGRAILHSVSIICGSGKFIWANEEKDNQYKDWFYAYNINDLSILAN